MSSAASAFRTSFSVFWRSCFIPAPLVIRFFSRARFCWARSSGHLRLDDRGELVDVDVLLGRDLLGELLEDHADLGQLGQELLLGLVDGEVGVVGLELDEQLAGLDAVADVVADPGDPADLLGADGDLVPPLERADGVDGPLDRPELDARPR